MAIDGRTGSLANGAPGSVRSQPTMSTIDLAAYLGRIEYSGPRSPGLETLRALHLAHATRVPFENLDIQMGRPMLLDLPSLEDKIVRRRRGGYCFEQNTLFQAALRTFGFDVIACEARVRYRAEGQVRPRTHMVLVVALDGTNYLCDVGFGGDGLLLPLALDGEPHDEYGRTLRAELQASEVVLQQAQADGWEDLYAFVPEARHPIDFVVANWFTSTHPESVFVKTLTVQRPTPTARHILRQLTYTVREGTGETSREIDRGELIPLLRRTFGIDLPDATAFSGIDGDRT